MKKMLLVVPVLCMLAGCNAPVNTNVDTPEVVDSVEEMEAEETQNIDDTSDLFGTEAEIEVGM